jgi:hypothetical protein
MCFIGHKTKSNAQVKDWKDALLKPTKRLLLRFPLSLTRDIFMLEHITTVHNNIQHCTNLYALNQSLDIYVNEQQMYE